MFQTVELNQGFLAFVFDNENAWSYVLGFEVLFLLYLFVGVQFVNYKTNQLKKPFYYEEEGGWVRLSKQWLYDLKFLVPFSQREMRVDINFETHMFRIGPVSAEQIQELCRYQSMMDMGRDIGKRLTQEIIWRKRALTVTAGLHGFRIPKMLLMTDTDTFRYYLYLRNGLRLVKPTMASFEKNGVTTEDLSKVNHDEQYKLWFDELHEALSKILIEMAQTQCWRSVPNIIQSLQPHFSRLERREVMMIMTILAIENQMEIPQQYIQFTQQNLYYLLHHRMGVI